MAAMRHLDSRNGPGVVADAYNVEFAMSGVCLVLGRSRRSQATAQFVRREVQAALGDAPVDIVSDGGGLRARLDAGEVDVVIVDGRLRWAAVPDVVAVVRAKLPAVPVVLLGDRLPVQAVVAAMKAGASDCVSPRPEALARALSECLKRAGDRHLEVERQRPWQDLFELAPIGLCSWTLDGRFLAVNPHVLAMLGCENGDLRRRTPASVAADPEEFRRLHEEVLQRDAPISRELEAVRHDGSRFWIRLTARTVRDDAGRPRFVVARCEDVSEDRQHREALRTALAEREVLIREVHHRVKNNLQIISSLLNLRFQGARDPAARDLLRESQLRIKAIALVHQRLYSSANLIRIDLENYVPNLVANVRDAYAPLGVPVTVDLDVAPVAVCMEHGIRLGLVLTELVANAFRHAFVGRDAGCLRITIRPRDPDHVEVRVEDDGIGLPEDLARRSADSLGLALVRNLVDQVRGHLSVESEPAAGTRFRFVFPRERAADAAEQT